MTVRDIIAIIEDSSWIIPAFLLTPPLISYGTGLLHKPGQGGRSSWKYFYSVLIFASCIPGIFASVITFYTLFFTGENLLDVNFIIYILPVITMITTMILTRKNADFDDLPGFDRLSGLMVVLAITFIIILAIQKTRLWLFFGGSIFMLIAIGAGLFALLQWGSYMLFRKKSEPKMKRPPFPDL